MNFRKTTSYALKILSFMAENETRGYSAKYLHEKLNIPRQYLRQLLTNLSKSGFIESTKGRSGGFEFRKNPGDIFVMDIINSIEGIDFFDHCILGFESCPFDNYCALHETWENARSKIKEVLENTSLSDLKKNKI